MSQGSVKLTLSVLNSRFVSAVWTGPPVMASWAETPSRHEASWGVVLPEAVWPGGSSSRQDPEPEPGGAEEQEEEGRAETDWFPWGAVCDNRSQPSKESSPVRESELEWSKARKKKGYRADENTFLLVKTVLSLKAYQSSASERGLSGNPIENMLQNQGQELNTQQKLWNQEC